MISSQNSGTEMQQQNMDTIHKTKVLIVDDDPGTCQLLALICRGQGYLTAVAGSGKDALEQVSIMCPDVILLDVMMPDMDGWTTYQHLRMISNAPVLFLTALGSAAYACRALQLGAADYVRKPFDRDELLARIAVALKGRDLILAKQANVQTALACPGRRPAVSVVIPAYNEETGLPLVLAALCNVLNHEYEIVVIDDGSSDKTVCSALAFPCRLIKHPYNLGKGVALRTGLQHAYGEKIIFIDADNTYPVEAIPALARLLEKFDLVRGVRVLGRSHIPRLNRMGNSLFDAAIRLLHAVEGGDVLSGMYGGRRECLLSLDLESTGFDIEAEICVKAQARGLSYGTLPITYASRVGDTKLHALHDGIRILWRLLQLASAYSPLTIFILPGLVLLMLGLVGVSLMQSPSLRLLLHPLAANGTFLLGMIGLLGAQLAVFGLAVYTAGMAFGLRGRANRLLDRACQMMAKRTTMLTGLAMGSLGFAAVTGLALDWLWEGRPDFDATVRLVAMSLSMLLGIQLFSSSVFFASLLRLQKSMPGSIQNKLDRFLSRLSSASL